MEHSCYWKLVGARAASSDVGLKTVATPSAARLVPINSRLLCMAVGRVVEGGAWWSTWVVLGVYVAYCQDTPPQGAPRVILVIDNGTVRPRVPRHGAAVRLGRIFSAANYFLKPANYFPKPSGVPCADLPSPRSCP